MKKIFYLCIALGVFIFQACDDESSSDGGASFARLSSNYFEADGTGTLQIPIKNYNGNASGIEFAFSGTATEGEDYEVVGFAEGILTITVFDDLAAERYETIRIQITNAEGGVGANPFHLVTIESNDPGFVDIDLVWPGAPDMDLVLLHEVGNGDFEIVAFSDPGHLRLDWKAADGLYGLSYNYYSGNVDPLDFTVTFTPTGVTLEGATNPLIFDATYTLANIDPNNIQIEQVFTKSGTEFTDFSDIEVPEEGSRKAELLVKMRKAIADYKANGN